MISSLSQSVIDYKGKKLIENYEPYNIFSKKFDPVEMMKKTKEKDDYQKSGNYVIITNELIETLSDFLYGKKVLEVMSGTGMLAWHLQENGVDILATDSGEWNLPEIQEGFVKRIDAVQALKKYDNADIILMCWPYMDDAAYKVLKSLNKNQKLICCGEMNGCTADRDFWNHYKCEVINEINYSSFQGFKDNFYIGTMI